MKLTFLQYPQGQILRTSLLLEVLEVATRLGQMSPWGQSFWVNLISFEDEIVPKGLSPRKLEETVTGVVTS